LQSLGLDLTHVRIRRYVPLRVYLSDANDNLVESVSTAINEVAGGFGFEISDEFPETLGSWFKNWFVKTKEVASQPEVAERLQKIERALQLKGLDLPQAEVDQKQANAAAKLMKAVEHVPNAAIQVGSILLVKLPSPNGPIIQIKTLTQRELIAIENDQTLLSSPDTLLQKLANLSSTRSYTPGSIEHDKPAKRRTTRRQLNNRPSA
jgi:hypothetical protein